ncbi:hypothetical protein NDU88_000979 [Pleurodeles waltl]|uniref:Uncharacterized protein n=1 Tax=Pleurodeles waltl TaxID=8319 RepID=A0AAV7SZ25_PLEWA|nr:hypothetical protein NDU88_000979 [Pleurodeles waltl]
MHVCTPSDWAAARECDVNLAWLRPFLHPVGAIAAQTVVFESHLQSGWGAVLLVIKAEKGLKKKKNTRNIEK